MYDRSARSVAAAAADGARAAALAQLRIAAEARPHPGLLARVDRDPVPIEDVGAADRLAGPDLVDRHDEPRRQHAGARDVRVALARTGPDMRPLRDSCGAA